MRTKHILTAMVLPALFAACTADEFVENGSSVSLEGRELLKSFPISVEGAGVDTRFAWNEEAAGGIGNWAWENTDKFSAFLVNNNEGKKPEEWQATDHLLTNYIYTSEDGASYTTTSAMVEGLYWFYAPARTSQGVGSSSLMSFDLATAQDADYWKSDAAKVFITPLYRLVAGNEPNNLALNLMNYYSRAVFPLTNNTDKTVTIRQIVLESSNPLVVKGEISVEAIKNYMYAFNEAGELVSVNNLDKVTTNDETNAKLRERLAEADLVKDNDKKVETNVLVLNLGDGVAITKGATESFTMLVPRTNKNTTCTVKIITDQGVVEVNATDQSNYARNVQFKHNGVMPMFGLASDNSFKAYSIEEEKFTDLGDARYVGSYDEMIALINTVNGAFSVYNMGDWKVDAAMADALSKSDSYVRFLQPITIEDTKEVKLTKVSFGRLADATVTPKVDELENTVTIAKGTKVSFDAADRNDTKNLIVGTMNIEEGAEVVLNDGDFYKAEINNAGTLTVNAGAKAEENSDRTEVASTGTLKLVGNSDVKVDLNGGNLEYAAALDAAGKPVAINYAAGAAFLELPETADLTEGDVNITVGVGTTLKVNGNRVANTNTLADGKTTYSVNFVNNGTLSVNTSAKLTLNGDLTNNGNVSGKELIINSTASNGEDAEINMTTLTISEGATVANSGTIIGTTVTNVGTITTVKGSRTTVTGGDGTINNTALAYVSAAGAGDQKIAYEIASAMNVEALGKLNLETLNSTYNVNKLIVKSALTIDDSYTIPSAIATIDFENGSSINVDPDLTPGFVIESTNININGNVTFAGFEKSKSTYTLGTTSAAATITIAKNSVLSIEYCKVAGNTGQNVTFKSEEPVETDPQGTVRGQVVVTDADLNSYVNVPSDEWFQD